MIRLLTLISLAIAVGACSRQPPAAEPSPARAVRLAEVQLGPAAPSVRASGLLTARDEAPLAFKVGGIIRRIEVREGDTVSEGQVLAALETAEVDASVAQAREAHRKAERDLARGRALHTDDVIPQEALDDLATAEAVSRAALRAAEYNRGYAVITAPAAGRVLRRLAEPRQLVTAGAPVLLVSDQGSGQVLELGLPDRDVVRLRIGQPAELRFDALPGTFLDGRVLGIGQAADPRTGTFRVEVSLTDDDPRLASGMIGHARIEVATGEAPISHVPLTALVEGTDEDVLLFTHVDTAGTVQAHRSGVAFIEGERAALTEALPAGTRVVTEGAAFLRDGDPVRVIE